MAASLFKWFIAAVLCTGHPLYISVTEISENTKDKTLEISCKMFTNDLEATLEKTTHSKVDLADPKDKKNTDKLVMDYIQKHLLLKADGKSLVLQFIGSEQESDGTWSYFQVNNISAVKKLDISNSLLYDLFDQEMNIMHVSIGNVKKSTRLNYPDAAASFEF